jgi:hypothetical protein
MPPPSNQNPLARRLRGRGAPIDYSQRSVKTKLFILVALLMLVLAVAERSRDPKTWQWLADMDKWERREEVNTRLPHKSQRTSSDDPASFVTTNPAASNDAPSESNPLASGPDPIERAWNEGWKEVIERLEDRDRTLLSEVLYAAQRRQPLPPGRHDAAAAAIQTANRLWEDYQAAAFQSIVTLSPADQVQWVDVLRQVNHRWSADVQPSLAAIVDGRTPSENEEILLAGFQRTLDELHLRRVEDDTLFLRPAEREIWLRLQGRARDTDPAELRKQSVGQVGYLQLFKQPQEYRGRLVTIRGTAMYAYRVAVGENYLGVKEHFVFWINPDGGPTSPIVVYALDVPPGFPAIPQTDDGSLTRLHEEVVVTGFFLKRGAYLGKDGTYTAPLMIANVPEWNRREVTLADTSRFSFGPAWLLPTIVASLVISIILFAVVWWRLRSSEAESHAVAMGTATGPANFDQVTVGASTHESLRALEEQERGRS